MESCLMRERSIVRSAPAHVEEMRWWLRQMPPDVEAIVMENSAVNPDLQFLAARWLNPTLVVWTNARSDHQDAWGEGEAAAARALAPGVPDGCALVFGGDPGALPAGFLGKRGGPTIIAPAGGGYRASNLALARAALDFMGELSEQAEAAMLALPPDTADFRVFDLNDGGTLAAAFSANDPESTEHLFSLLGWECGRTSLLYSDRADRPARRRSFAPFMRRPWLELRTLRGREDRVEVMEWMRGRNVFGCGNVAGLPLRILEDLLGGGYRWTMPDW
jgi:hypothetical protein